MGSLASAAIMPAGNKVVEIDVDELILRLKSISSECSIEVMQLAILSMLDEIDDAVMDKESE